MASFVSRFRRPVVSCLLSALWAAACVTAGESKDDDSTFDFNDGGLDRFVVDAIAPMDSGSGIPGSGISPLCGIGQCGGFLPDDSQACEGFDGGAGYPASGGYGGSGGTNGIGTGGQHDASPDAYSNGATDAAPQAAFVEAGRLASPSTFDASVALKVPDGGFAFTSSVTADASTPKADATEWTAPVYACHVRRAESGPVHRCETAGRGEQGAPCTSSRDCAPGLGCVGDGSAAKCLHFCCAGGGPSGEDGGRAGCDEGTYCAERPLRDDAGDDPLMVPVCVPADHCDLDDPYPCTAADCTCPEGETCSIVRNDGTTSCVVPGTGLAGEACPCAPGLFCSFATNTCVKFCRTDVAGDTTCGTGRCQATVNLPEGYGLCVAMAESR